MAGKPNRVVSLGDRSPYIEGRAWRFDRPSQRVERVGDQTVSPRIDLIGRVSLFLSPIQRLDRRPLHRLEDPRVDVGLQLADEPDEVGAPAYPADPPARH